MNWMNRLNERAALMGQMLETIGIDAQSLEQTVPGDTLNLAIDCCASCERSDECRDWLAKHREGSREPMASCPNSDLLKSWANKKPS